MAIFKKNVNLSSAHLFDRIHDTKALLQTQAQDLKGVVEREVTEGEARIAALTESISREQGGIDDAKARAQHVVENILDKLGFD